MEYVRSSLPVIVNQFSPPDAGHLLYLTGKLVGMQFYPDIAASFPATHDSGPQGFGALLLEFLHAEGDDADSNQSNGCVTISQKQWGLIAGVPDYHPMCLQALRGLIEGLMTAHDRRLSLDFWRRTTARLVRCDGSSRRDRLPRPTTDAFQRKTFTTPARRDPIFLRWQRPRRCSEENRAPWRRDRATIGRCRNPE
jgi:hypothetical protein